MHNGQQMSELNPRHDQPPIDEELLHILVELGKLENRFAVLAGADEIDSEHQLGQSLLPDTMVMAAAYLRASGISIDKRSESVVTMSMGALDQDHSDQAIDRARRSFAVHNPLVRESTDGPTVSTSVQIGLERWVERMDDGNGFKQLWSQTTGLLEMVAFYGPDSLR